MAWCMLLAIPLAGHAQVQDVHFYVENDATSTGSFSGTDQWYTNGVGFSFAHRLDDVDFPGNPNPRRRAVGLVVGQLMYTPVDLNATQLIPDDRPYAGYLFGGVYYQQATDRAYDWLSGLGDPNVSVLDHMQLDLGVVGPSALGKQAQDFWHDFIDVEKFRGWDNQLRDEPTVQVNLRRKWRLRYGGQESLVAWDVIPQVGLAVGNVQRYLEAGATARVGWRLPDDFGAPQLRDPSTKVLAAYGQPSNTWTLYGYAGVKGRVVEHDIFIEGSDFRSGPGIKGEPLVGELRAGFAFAYRLNQLNIEIGWAQIYLTPEFVGQDRMHGYSALHLGLTCLF